MSSPPRRSRCGEALQPEFKLYAARRRRECQARSPRPSRQRGLAIVSGGTDTHLMLVDLRPQELDRPRRRSRRSSAPASPATRTAFRSTREKPTVTSGVRLGSPAATTRGFGQAGVPPGRRADRRGAATGWRGSPATMPAVEARVRADGRARCAPASRSIPTADLSDSSLGGQTRRRRTCAVRSAVRGHPGQGFAADRRSRRDPPAPVLPQLRGALHDLRAGAAARADRGQEERPARALRPRQAGALDLHRAAQAAGRARAGRARDQFDRAPARKLGRDRNPERHDRRTGDGGAGDASIRSPISASPRSTAISARPRISASSSAASPPTASERIDVGDAATDRAICGRRWRWRGAGSARSGPTPRSAASSSRTGAVVGRGWTQPGGRPHAETEALAPRRRSGARAPPPMSASSPAAIGARRRPAPTR